MSGPATQAAKSVALCALYAADEAVKAEPEWAHALEYLTRIVACSDPGALRDLLASWEVVQARCEHSPEMTRGASECRQYLMDRADQGKVLPAAAVLPGSSNAWRNFLHAVYVYLRGLWLIKHGKELAARALPQLVAECETRIAPELGGIRLREDFAIPEPLADLLACLQPSDSVGLAAHLRVLLCSEPQLIDACTQLAVVEFEHTQFVADEFLVLMIADQFRASEFKPPPGASRRLGPPSLWPVKPE